MVEQQKPTDIINTRQQQQQQPQQQQQQQQQQQTPISAVSIKLTHLWESNSVALFIITETKFNNANISIDITKYNCVISSSS